jgi:signal transduction histidine kinase
MLQSLVQSTARRPFPLRGRSVPWIIGSLVCLGLLAAFAATAWLTYREQVEDAERETRNLSLVLDKHVQGSIGAIAATLQATEEALELFQTAAPGAGRSELVAFLDRVRGGATEVFNLFVIGPDGQLHADALNTAATFDFLDRSFFKIHRERADAGLFLSEPLLSWIGRGWHFVASRRLSRADGAFAGVIGASIPLIPFVQLYGTLAIGDGGAITLRDRQGIIYGRHPTDMDTIGRPGPNSEVVDAVHGGQPSGTKTFVPVGGLKDRIVSFRAVEGTPFIVSVSAARAAVLASWQRGTFRYGLATLALIAAVGVLVWGVTRTGRALRESDEAAARASRRLTDAIEALPASFVLFDADERLVMVNRWHGQMLPPLGEYFVPGATFKDLLQKVRELGIVAGSRGETWAAERSATLGLDIADTEFKTNDGRWIQVIARRMSDGGRVCLYIDISHRKQALEVLLQAQKMEAVGQLTGGMAHDFNNLLTVIIGNSSELIDGLKDKPELHRSAQMIEQAALRGAALTHRLLAFARQQALRPAKIDVNALVGGMEGLLRRTLGENIDIVVSLADDLAPVMADAAQVENALLNLVINSRDAMPDGGTLTIETANATLDADYAQREGDLKPGNYAVLAVTDTGTGMSPEVQRRVFEPFFTTKEVGKGSGLGLSMVFGFAKQSGGHVKIYSEVGVGTTIKLYLPWASDQEQSDERTSEPALATPRGHEIVLVVEDDEAVRAVATATLRALGYTVHEAGNGPEALSMLDALDEVDLLFTDVVLPKGMNGRQLADEAQRRRPGLKILYTSGYTANAIIHQGRLDPGVQLLNKPYRKSELARRVREALSVSSV